MAIFKAETTIKVPFYDNDPMGVVWHGNYVKYLEIARCDTLAKIGYDYMDMKNEQRKIVQMTTKLSEAEEDLLDLLKKLGLYDAKLWLSQVRALVYSKDMVEVRHDLNTQRQKLRKQIEYNENRIEEAKKNIKEAAVRNPDCMDEAIHIIEQFESKNVRNQ